MLLSSLAVAITVRSQQLRKSASAVAATGPRGAALFKSCGRVRLRIISGTHLSDGDGVPRTISDHSTEGWHLADQRQEMIERLLEIDRQKSDLLAVTNHELRSPLAAINGYLEMLLDGEYGYVSEQLLQVLAVLQCNTRRLQVLMDDVSILDRLDKGRPSENFEMLDLGDCVKQVLSNLTPNVARAQVRLTASIDGRWPVVGDRERLERAIDNVLNNAVKYTPPGGKVDLMIVTGGDGATVELHCTDSGMGIPAQEIGKLFTRFARASNAIEAQVPGTGLGLVIVRTIVEEHGGRVSLSSEEGTGVHVRLVLPMASADPPGPVPG
ncbi:sensor histidine kinase [Kocuria rosea]|uniref:sensor histidine kinase n=1 Tax=Kocuria rosea TaxID=1275 RepID=UPI002040499E|nr:HAMP domain-containing histidine kinase [Kocuria rosea]